MRECIEASINSKWTEEALSRARYHLSIIYNELGIEQEEAQRLKVEALKVLDKYSHTVPEFLQGVEDKMLLFDDMQPAENGRYTGWSLLKRMQDSFSQNRA